MSNKILVTGGVGYIGLHTTVELCEVGYEVVLVDDLSRADQGMLERLEALLGYRPAFYQVDCKDREALVKVFQEEGPIEGVIHFAAYKAVGESVERPFLYYQNNVGSQITLLECMAAHGVKGLVFSSSCTVYGQPGTLPVTEKSPEQEPDSPYGRTKRIGEWIMEDAVHSGQELHGISLRYFNPIGAHPSGMIGESPIDTPTNLVPYITKSALGELDELVVNGNDYGTRDGTCIRDYIHVVDLARAHVKALERVERKAADKAYEIFNVGTGEGATVMEVLRAFEKATGQELPYRIGPRRPGDVERIWADTQKAERELEWKARFSLQDAMRDAWQWEKNRCDIGNNPY
ncbi:MAG: UDP-glucose 4-epimerase GalE [Flavobacteriales bacterium]